ncbi:TVP38/TMEM64 family protein [Candidatus Bipolaricaulota bacterium]
MARPVRCVLMGRSGRDRKLVRSLIIVLVVAAAALIGWFVSLGLTGKLAMFSSAEALQAWVDGFGAAAPVVFFVLQVVQVIVSPIPGGVTTLVGAMLFGFWQAFALSTAAVLTGSLLAFGLARALGRPLVIRLVGTKITERYLGAMTSRSRIALLLMFLLPFFPDDALSFVAGLTGLSWPFFVFVMACTRPWGLLFSSLVGSGMVHVPGWGWALIAAGTAALAWASMKWGPAIEQRVYQRITGGSR